MKNCLSINVLGILVLNDNNVTHVPPMEPLVLECLIVAIQRGILLLYACYGSVQLMVA